MSEIRPATDDQIDVWDFPDNPIQAVPQLIARIRQEQARADRHLSSAGMHIERARNAEAEVERLREWQKDALDYLGEFCDGGCEDYCRRCELINQAAEAQQPAAQSTYPQSLPTELQSCGHPVSAVYTGGEGTSFCQDCEEAARAGQPSECQHQLRPLGGASYACQRCGLSCECDAMGDGPCPLHAAQPSAVRP